MTASLFSIGTSALTAARLGLSTTSHNISNANTDGYSRQSIQQATRTSLYTGAGFLGQGVEVTTVKRQYSGFLETQLRTSQSQLSAYQARHDAMRQIDDLLADPSAGLSPALDGFWTGVQTLSGYPADGSARQNLIASAQTLTSRFQSLNARLDVMRSDANGRIEGSVDLINNTTAQIASLNERIRLAASGGQPPNDLLDQRDALVKQLAHEIDVQTVVIDDGSVNVFFGNGQPAVVGERAYRVVAQPDPAEPDRMQIGIDLGSGIATFRPEDLRGGTLSGLLAFRDGALRDTANALGRIAVGFADAFNRQHMRGQDLNGALGAAFFSFAGPEAFASGNNTGTGAVSATFADTAALRGSDYKVRYDGANWSVTRLSDDTTQTFATLPQTIDGVTISASGTPAAGDVFTVRPTAAGARDIAVAMTDPRGVAAGAPVAASANRGNLGNATISAPTIQTPGNANLRQTVTITFTGANTFDVTGTGTGNPTGVAYTAGGALSFNGWTVAISGTPKPGDTFTIETNAGAIGDNKNALALHGMQTQRVIGGGTESIADAYAGLVARVGNLTRAQSIGVDAQTTLVEQAANARDGLSGVNLDEEAANLLRYQQAYQAAAQIISVGQQLFDTILGIGA